MLLTRYYCMRWSDGLYYNKLQHLNYRVRGILLSLTMFSWQHFTATLSIHYTPQDTSPWHLQHGAGSAATPAWQNETTHDASHCIWLCKMAAELLLLLRLSNGNSDPQWTARSWKSPWKGFNISSFGLPSPNWYLQCLPYTAGVSVVPQYNQASAVGLKGALTVLCSSAQLSW